MKSMKLLMKGISLLVSVIMIVTLLSVDAFADDTTDSPLTIVDGVVIDCDENATGEIVIPDGVTSIGYRAFYACTI